MHQIATEGGQTDGKGYSDPTTGAKGTNTDKGVGVCSGSVKTTKAGKVDLWHGVAVEDDPIKVASMWDPDPEARKKACDHAPGWRDEAGRGGVGADWGRVVGFLLSKRAPRTRPGFQHRPPHRRARGGKMVFLPPPRLFQVDIEEIGDEPAHMRVDMGQQPFGDRIQGVVEVEDPALNSFQTGYLSFFG